MIYSDEDRFDRATSGPERHLINADAHLIAAAPRLYAAAALALEDLEPHEWTDLPDGYAVKATIDALRAALRLARGEEPTR